MRDVWEGVKDRMGNVIITSKLNETNFKNKLNALISRKKKQGTITMKNIKTKFQQRN